MSDALVRWIRTVVPIVIGTAITWLAGHLGATVDDDTKLTVASAATAIVIAAYYSLVALLEAKWPAAGWLLGHPKAQVA